MKKQQLATVTILEIAYGLLKTGRPRKRPGKPRAEATFDNGYTKAEPTSYRSAWARNYSLTGALKAAAYSIRREVPAATLSRARVDSINLVIDAINEQDGHHYISFIEDADQRIADSRAILRAVKSAAKEAVAA